MELKLGEVAQDVAFIVDHGPEECGHVMVLQHRLVIVDDGQVRGGLDVEVVGGAGVVVVVDHGRHQQAEYLQVRHPVLEPRLGDDPVSALEDISSVQVVVVGVAIASVSYLKVTKEGLQGGRRDLELVDVPIMIQQMISHELKRTSFGAQAVGKQVKVPVINPLSN